IPLHILDLTLTPSNLSLLILYYNTLIHILLNNLSLFFLLLTLFYRILYMPRPNIFLQHLRFLFLLQCLVIHVFLISFQFMVFCLYIFLMFFLSHITYLYLLFFFIINTLY